MIVASAIKFFHKEDTELKFPQIWTGLRHADILERMQKTHTLCAPGGYIEGFLTFDDKFLDRYEAAQYAIDIKQIDPGQIWGPYDTKILHSEELWPED